VNFIRGLGGTIKCCHGDGSIPSYPLNLSSTPPSRFLATTYQSSDGFASSSFSAAASRQIAKKMVSKMRFPRTTAEDQHVEESINQSSSTSYSTDFTYR
jgi:hypothetical protein